MEITRQWAIPRQSWKMVIRNRLIPCCTKYTSHFSLYDRNMSHFKLTDSKKMINLQNKNDIYHFGSKFYCERYDINVLILSCVWHYEENILKP